MRILGARYSPFCLRAKELRMSDPFKARVRERTLRRYAEDPAFKREVHLTLGVRHVPLHPEGDCEFCDAERARRAADSVGEGTQ